MNKNKIFKIILFTIILAAVISGGIYMYRKFYKNEYSNKNNYDLKQVSSNIISETIKNRRSIRNYANKPLDKKEILTLLFAAQGITDKKNNLRAAPSAGATYPLELYIAVGNAKNLEPGIYKYNSKSNDITKIESGDKRSELCNNALSQEWIKQAAAVIIICAIYERTTNKYSENGKKYVHMEVGAVAENVYLQAVPLNIGTVFVGAFDTDKVRKTIKANKNEEPLCLMPLGKKNINDINNNNSGSNAMTKQALEIVDLDVEKVIEELNKAFADEWFAYYQYWIGAKVAKGPLRPSVVEELVEHANEELKHADMVAERIIQLNGTPILSPKEWYEVSSCQYAEPSDFNVVPILKQNIKAEQCAIKVYNNLLKLVKDKDFVTYNMVLSILEDEIEHETDLENLLEDISLIK
ncbi:SagB/ThcOx family dehydrogenase [Candidatus Dependentiae bacterium]|nr:SagB/ThcOx family dehydrogenase [Candidatus Dependentiae bacterium]